MLLTVAENVWRAAISNKEKMKPHGGTTDIKVEETILETISDSKKVKIIQYMSNRGQKVK